ncbi:MAG: GTP cyclohydrolase I FolE [Anaerolineae bacterium]|nr:GTP cyclohydrolase I FolE [Anaerolineae bacterium]NIO00111.1 GTP cyclohydrolase I FolE [Anaerolineae bacterium]NIQ82882.1 GTP cyclohydrolase I FolE [Anaerolineae bacterium]
MIDQGRIQTAVEEIIAAIGENPTREGLVNTPSRIAELYAEVFSGVDEDAVEILAVGFEEEEHEEMVVLKDIPFYSMCEHHFLPFHGLAHVGYIPAGRLVGISKLARVVEVLARRPQLQERLTGQIADTIMDALKARGVGVVIEAEHLCMTMRGIRKPGSRLVTSANRGIFRSYPATRAEFFSILGMSETSRG